MSCFPGRWASTCSRRSDGYKPEARSTTRQGDRDWLATLRQARVVCSHIKLNAHRFSLFSVPVLRQWTHPGDFLHVSSSFVLMDTCSHPDAACVHLHEHWWTHAATYPACVHQLHLMDTCSRISCMCPYLAFSRTHAGIGISWTHAGFRKYLHVSMKP